MNGRGKSVKSLEKAGRKVDVAERFLQGESQIAIAERLGLSRATVQRDLAELKAEWSEKSITTIGEALNLELQRLANLERQAWRGWERSQQAKEPDGPTRDGNPKFLDVVLKCVARRASLLGLDAPKKLLISDDEKRQQASRLEDMARRYRLFDNDSPN